MQSQVSSIRQSTKTSRFANQGYNSGDNLFACPACVSRRVWPRDITIRRIQCICAFELGRNGIYEDATWIRRAWWGTQAKWSALWPSPVPHPVAAKTNRWNEEIKLWRNSSGVVRGTEKRYYLLFPYGRYRVCIQKGPARRGWKKRFVALNNANNSEKRGAKIDLRASCDPRPLRKSLMALVKSIKYEDL